MGRTIMMQTLGARHRRPRHNMRGITLLELMIVLVIVGILASIGYPSYRGYVDRARRADGKALLLEAAARMERYYYDQNRYSTTLTDIGYGAGTVTSPEQNYTLAAAAGATGSIVTSYTLTATPNAAKPFSDPACGNLTLDSRGVQGRTGTETMENCWGR